MTAFLVGHGANVTTAGVRLHGDRAFRVGSSISFCVRLVTGQDVLKGKGLVRWVRADLGGGVVLGVTFSELDADSLRLIELLLASRGREATSPEPPPPPPGLREPEVTPTTASPRIPSVKPLAPLIPPLKLAPAKNASDSARVGMIPLPAPEKKQSVTPADWFASPDDGEELVLTTADLETIASPPVPSPPPEVVTPHRQHRTVAPEPVTPFRQAAHDEVAVRVASASPPAAGPGAIRAAVERGELSEDAPLVRAAAAAPARPPPSGPPRSVPAPATAAATSPVPPIDPPTPRRGTGVSERATDAAGKSLEALRIARAIDWLRKKEYAQAEAELQAAIVADPNSARLRYELGLVYFDWSDDRSDHHDGAAEASFARAAELDPAFDAPLVHLGQVQLRRKLWKDADRSFREALRRNPHARGATEGLSVLAAHRARRILAGGAVAAVIVLATVVPLAVFQARSASAAQQRVQAAPAVAAAPSAPTEASSAPAGSTSAAPPPVSTPPPEPPVVIASASVPPASTTPAAAAVTTASPPARPPEVTATPAPPPKPKRAPAASSAGASSGGGSAAIAALVKQGDAALRAGKVDEALAAFQKALASNPKYAPAHRGLGSVYVMQGRDAEAIAAYKKYLDLAPSASDAPRIRALVMGME